MISQDILIPSISDSQGQNVGLFGGLNVPAVEGSNNNLPTVTPDYQLTADKLAGWLRELRNQPRFRLEMDLACAYYDGNQVDAETEAALADRGQSAIVDNQIGPVIRQVIGQQKKARTDTIVKPEAGETNSEVAEALSCELKEYSKMCHVDLAKSDAYEEMIKAGVSHLEVSTNDDPFGNPFIYGHVHRRECYWDWRAKPDYSNARYFIRRKWIDEDQLILAFPEQKDFIESALGSRAMWDMELMTNQLSSRGNDHQTNNGFDVTVEQYEWMNITRKRLLTYEIWYRVKVRDLVFKMPNGKVMEYDATNMMHSMLATAGMIDPYEASFDRIRVSFWIGPQRVGDYASPYKHKKFPYIPMFCFREDRTNIPYGLIRSMMSPQDIINATKTKLHWLLNAKWVEATDDAVPDHAVAADEVARPDGYVIRNNKPGSIFDVHENTQLSQQQINVMLEAKESLQTNAGVHNSTLGRDSGATSGIAINSIVEQDSITLTDPSDSFNQACKDADGIFLELIMEHLSTSKDHAVTVDDDLGQKRVVVLNQQGTDPQTGLPTILNDLSKVNVGVVLADSPQTPTFKNQQLLQLTELIRGLPEQLQAQVAPDMILETDNPRRKKIAEKIAKFLGQQDNVDPEKEQLKQQVQELTQKLMAKAPPEITQATILKLAAETAKLRAEIVDIKEKTQYTSIQTAGLIVTNPGLVSTGDSLLLSAGYEDANGEPLATVSTQQPNPNVLQGGTVGNVPNNTNPTSPPAPPSPGIGADSGIETKNPYD
jgi:hypothetical protein